MHARSARLAAATAAAVGFLALAGGAAASPPTGGAFEFQIVDTQLCSFPLEVTARGQQRDHVRLAQGVELFTSTATFTLRNLATDATSALTTTGTSIWDYAQGTATFTGQQLVFGPIPFAAFSGQVQVGLDDFVVQKRTGTKSVVDPCALVGPSPAVPRTTPAPWDAPLNVLGAMKLAGLTPLVFGLALHTHTHLDVIVDGAPVTVPAGVGIVEPLAPEPGAGLESQIGALSPLHTHFDDGVLHVEADTGPFTLTLGQFFDEWQVRLSSSCLGSYCAQGAKTLRVYVDGAQVSGDPRSVVLGNCDEVALVYGAPHVPARPPATYAFDPELGC
jgi:hypothetical protein